MKTYRYEIINTNTLEVLDRCNDLQESYLVARDYMKADKINTAVIDTTNNKVVSSCTKSKGL
jgi:hypothetical protein